MASVHFSKAQTFELEEKKAVQQNGIEYGYYITNEQNKVVKGDDYTRYEVTIYITNNTGCTKLYRNNFKTMITDNVGNKLALFNCTNATGKRLTVKNANIEAREFIVATKVTINNKEETKNAKVGYIFRNGETLQRNIIFIVPKNETPKIICSINTPEEM